MEAGSRHVALHPYSLTPVLNSRFPPPSRRTRSGGNGCRPTNGCDAPTTCLKREVRCGLIPLQPHTRFEFAFSPPCDGELAFSSAEG